MKNLYPTYRGKTDSGEVIMEMVDRYGRTWGTGIGSDRVQAMYNARHAMPPKGMIRQVLQIAVDHPVKAAILTGIAVTTYSAARYRDSAYGDGETMSLGTKAIVFIGASLLAWAGIKVLGYLERRFSQ